ncbi:MAG: hypothetical protein ACTSWY_04475 [Promethearchaeota archaeon]
MNSTVEKFININFNSAIDEIKEYLFDFINIDKDKWSQRFILLGYFFLGDEANEITTKSLLKNVFGDGDTLPGLLKTFNLYGIIIIPDKSMKKLEQPDLNSTNWKNIPNKLARENILLQKSGNNIELTPIGKKICQFLFYRFLNEKSIDLSTLIKLSHKKSFESKEISLLTDFTTEELQKIHLLEEKKIEGNLFYIPTKFLREQIEFILENPYIDLDCSDDLKRQFYSLIANNLIRLIQSNGDARLITETSEKVSLSDVKWIYQLELKNYRVNRFFDTRFFEIIKNYSDHEEFKIPNVVILKSGPGTGKSVWMKQKSLDILKNKGGIPFYFNLNDFNILNRENFRWISYKEKIFSKINIPKEDIKDTFFSFLNLTNDKAESIFWIKSYLKLVKDENKFLFLDAWDELDHGLCNFFTNLIEFVLQIPNSKIKIVISTRFIDTFLEKFIIEMKPKSRFNFKEVNNVIEIESPKRGQIIEYFKFVGAEFILDNLNTIEKTLRHHLSPMDLWILSLFPNFKVLPKNRAELYERWIKYEVIMEFHEKIKPNLKNIQFIEDLNNLLKNTEPIIRERDKQEFTIFELLDGPVPSITPKEDDRDYSIMNFLPSLIYNRFAKPNFFFNYDQIIQSNPLFKRFICREFGDSLRPNFRLINPHYDVYLGAIHCFNNYIAGKKFDFLDKKEIEDFFKDILLIRKERTSFDQLNDVSNEYILLRNTFSIIKEFHDGNIGFPINKTGPFVYMVKMRNFIDPFKDQTYKYYWEILTKENSVILSKEMLDIFDNVEKTLVGEPKNTRLLLKNILHFQGVYVDEKVTLSEITEKINIDVPFLIPIIIHAFDRSKTESIPDIYLKKLTLSKFANLPYIKLWIYKELILNDPNSIIDLTNFSLEHTYNYLLKFCVTKIIPPLISEISDRNFDLSLKLFQRIKSKKYRQILIFQWSNHYLSEPQIDKIVQVEENFYVGKEIRLDLKYLLILHGRYIEYLHVVDIQKIPNEKIFRFLLILASSGLYTSTSLETFIRGLSDYQIIYAHKKIIEEFSDFNFRKEKLPNGVDCILRERFQKWWKENTPYKRKGIKIMLDEIYESYSMKENYYQRVPDDLLFKIQRYFDNYEYIEKRLFDFIFKECIDFLKKLELLFNEKSYLNGGFEKIFESIVKWILASDSQELKVKFFENFSDFKYDDIFLKILQDYPENFPLFKLKEKVTSNPQDYLLHSFFSSNRKSHPDLPTKNSKYPSPTDRNKLFTLRLMDFEDFSKFANDHFDIHENSDLIRYVYNMVAYGSIKSYKKVAELWEEKYCDTTAVSYEDPSLYIWGGIPYSLLEEIYKHLDNEIAKVFYIVCLSIYDTFKPKELNELHNNFSENAFIIEELRKISKNAIRNALYKFIQADWDFKYFSFLLHFIDCDGDIAENLFERVRSGRKFLSDLMSPININRPIELSLENGLFDINKEFIKKCPDNLKKIVEESCVYYGSLYSSPMEKNRILSILLNSNDLKLLNLVTELWERHGNPEIKKERKKFEKIKKIFDSTNNIHYLNGILHLHFGKIKRNNTQTAELEEKSNELKELETIYNQKIESNSIIYYDKSQCEPSNLKNHFEIIKEDIDTIKQEIIIRENSLSDFIGIISSIDINQKRKKLTIRYPNNYYKELNVLSNKIGELHSLKEKFKENQEIFAEINSKIDWYEQDLKKIRERTNSTNSQYLEEKFESFNKLEEKNLGYLIKDKDKFHFKNSPKNLLYVFSKIKNDYNKIKFAFHSFQSVISPDFDGFESNESIRLKKLELNTLKKEFKKSLSHETIDLMYNYFKYNLKENTDASEFYNLNFNSHIEAVKKVLTKIPLDIGQIEIEFEKMGDSHEFCEYMSLIAKAEPYSHLSNEKAKLILSIPEGNLIKLRKNIFYFMLRARELNDSDLRQDISAYGEDDIGISIENELQEIVLDSLKNDYFKENLENLFERGRKDFYQIIKNFVIFQLDFDVEECFSEKILNNIYIHHIPPYQEFLDCLNPQEEKRSQFLSRSKKYCNIIKMQLLSIEQLFNNFKFN